MQINSVSGIDTQNQKQITFSSGIVNAETITNKKIKTMLPEISKIVEQFTPKNVDTFVKEFSTNQFQFTPHEAIVEIKGLKLIPKKIVGGLPTDVGVECQLLEGENFTKKVMNYAKQFGNG